VELEANQRERQMHNMARRLSEIESLCEGAISQLLGISERLQKKWLMDKAPSILRNLVQKSQARMDLLSEQIKELATPRDQASLATAVRKAQFNAEAAASTAEKLQANKGESSTDGTSTAAMGEVAAAAAAVAASSMSTGVDDAQTAAHTSVDGPNPSGNGTEKPGDVAADGVEGTSTKTKEAKAKAKSKSVDIAELAQDMIAETQAMWSTQLCTNVERLLAVLLEIWRAPVMDKVAARPERPIHLQSEKCLSLNVRTKTTEEIERSLGINGDEDTSVWDRASALDLAAQRASFKKDGPAVQAAFTEGRGGEYLAADGLGSFRPGVVDVLTREEIKRRASAAVRRALPHVDASSAASSSTPHGASASDGSTTAKDGKKDPSTADNRRETSTPTAVTQSESSQTTDKPAIAKKRVTIVEPSDGATKKRTPRRKGPTQPFVFDDKE